MCPADASPLPLKCSPSRIRRFQMHLRGSSITENDCDVGTILYFIMSKLSGSDCRQDRKEQDERKKKIIALAFFGDFVRHSFERKFCQDWRYIDGRGGKK